MPSGFLHSVKSRFQASRVSAFGGDASLAAVQKAFRLGEKVAPRPTAMAAQRVWFRVPPAPPRSRRDRGIPAGERLDLRINRRRINAHSWGSGPAVLLVHGWSGWWQQLSVYVEPLVAAGFRVVAWDAPSHGDSEPGRHGKHYSSIADLADGVTAVAAAVGPVHGVVAHSAGAMAACTSLADGGIDPDRVVLISPSVSGDDHIAYLTDRLAWGPKTQLLVRDYALRRTGINLADFEVPRRIAAADRPLPPALFFHDLGDVEVPTDSAARLGEAWPGAEIVTTTGYDHFKVLWAPETIARTVEFLSADSGHGVPPAGPSGNR